MKRCVIVGAGIVGQMSALALLDRGWSGKSFLILEDLGLSLLLLGLGGGILSPLFPWRYPSELNALCETATDRYQRLTERLQGRQLLGADVLNRSGMWMEVVSGDRDAAEQWLQDWKGAWEWQALPFGSRRLNGVFCPQLGSIRNPRLLKGLRKYLVDQGVQFVQELVRGWGATWRRGSTCKIRGSKDSCSKSDPGGRCRHAVIAGELFSVPRQG